MKCFAQEHERTSRIGRDSNARQSGRASDLLSRRHGPCTAYCASHSSGSHSVAPVVPTPLLQWFRSVAPVVPLRCSSGFRSVAPAVPLRCSCGSARLLQWFPLRCSSGSAPLLQRFRSVAADFFQLLCVALQWYVFWIENSSTQRQLYGGGDNKNIKEDLANNAPNPVEDFLSCKE